MVQPCGDHLKACSGAVCKVGSDKNNKNTISLGALTDVKFDVNDLGLKVRYTQVINYKPITIFVVVVLATLVLL